MTPFSISRLSLNLYGLIGLVLLLAALGFYGVWRYSGTEEKRELNHWQVRLNLIADSRQADVNEWVEDQFSTLKGLADNTSLQLYMTELMSVEGDRGRMNDEPAQASILRSLLSATAQQRGFDPAMSSEPIAANVNPIGQSGLALVDNNGKLLLATQAMPPIEGAIADWLKQVPMGQQQLLDIHQISSGELQIGFTVPVFALQGEGTNAQIGRVVGIKQVDTNLFARLKHPGITEKTLETVLVRQEGENLVYLSPLKDGTAPMSKRIAANTEELEAAYALNNTGEFAIKRDYAFAKVLMTSRQVSGTPWRMIVKIDRDEALAEGDSWRLQTSAILLLSILLIGAVIIGAWWYGSSRRAMDLFEKSNKLAAQTAAQEKLLRLVTNSQPEGVFIVDHNNHYRFVNQQAAEDVGLSSEFILGKDLGSVMGPARAKDYVEANHNALDTSRPVSRVWRHVNEEDGAERVIRSEHIPLPQIPIESLPEQTAGVLVVDQDITEVMQEREGRERILNQLIGTLVKIVDQRDPFAANHSSLVAKVSRAIAEEMGLDSVTIETTETAGNLMNIGKIIVPSEVLTKNQSLSDAEMNAIRNSMQTSANILQDIDFAGPVVDTLKQAQEHVDGTGPLGMKGEQILLSARIIGVANNFVAMISPRSWRKAMPLKEATKSLLDQIDKKFDRKVAVALINYIENKGGREVLEDLANHAPKELAIA